VHLVELTPAGDALFMRLRQTAVTFDEQLRAGMSEREVTQLHRMLGKLHDNVTAT
jgi:MarR family transcriptional regulator for hemolysin